MLNLIKNEYAKIFHKISTYILLALLLISIVLTPLFTLVTTKISNTFFSVISYEDEIKWAEESGDFVYAEILKKCDSLGIPMSEVYGEGSGWMYTAIDDLYRNYWVYFGLTEKQIEEYLNYYGYESYETMDTFTSMSESDKANYEDFFNKAISYVEKNDWKSYFSLKIDEMKKSNTKNDIYVSDQIYYYQYLVDNNIEPGSGSWQEKALDEYLSHNAEYQELKAAKDKGDVYDEAAFEVAERMTLISKYRLENNVSSAIYEYQEYSLFSDGDIYTITSDFYNNMKSCISILIFVLIIVIIVASNIISKEFSQGTIKFLLINPYTRTKIFWSKYITIFTYALGLTIATFVLEFLMSMIIYGVSDINAKLLVVESGRIIASSGFMFIVFRYLLAFIEILIAFTIAFMISSLFRNSALAISISIIVYFIGTTVCQVAAMLKLDFFRYTIFAAQDLTSIINGNPPFVHMTTGFAVAVIAIHMVLLLLTAHDSFKKKNI